MKLIRFIIIFALASALMAAILSACSTTSRIPEGQTLYTGVKHIKYHQDSVKIDPDVEDLIFVAVDVSPNNPLYSPYYRTPFPIGLWVYNHWDKDSKGFKGWLYKLLVAQPVLISRVRPQMRVDMINTLLRNNGYFTSSASYELNYNNEKQRKASVSYDIIVHPPYTIGNIQYTEMGTPVSNIIDSVARVDPYFQTGSRYCLDSLNYTRIRITNALRDRGYYNFRPEYIEYLADSTTRRGIIDMRIVKAANVPNIATVQYLTNEVTATVQSYDGGGVPDTLEFRNCKLIKKEPVHITDRLIPSNIRSRRGRPFRVGNMDRTQLYLSRLGIFSNIDMQVTPLDSLTPEGKGLINLDINCTLDKPYEVKLEVQGTSSNSFIGPGLEASVTHKNAFGGGEKLSASLTAAYEWQTGRGGREENSTDINSYEFGTKWSLAVPRLLAPRFIDRMRRYVNWTRFSLSGSFMNRPNFFKMAQAAAEMSWEWHPNKIALNEFTPFSLTYSKLITTTVQFDSVMAQNPAIAQSFEDTFIPEMRYSYTLDKELSSTDAITWSSTVVEAGNIFSVIWGLAGSHNGEKELFGTPFSQFIKGQTQVVWRHRLSPQTSLVSRAFVGAVHAYGNMKQVPYSEQFYTGGANSLRAFTARTLGPGKYRPQWQGARAYYDQTGTFMVELNCEYRFPLFSYFKGALFLDAGNVWLLKDDPYRPGGTMSNFFDELALGTGAGVRFDMDMLVIRADMGIALHAPYDTGHHGYFNLGSPKNAFAFHLAIGYPF